MTDAGLAACAYHVRMGPEIEPRQYELASFLKSRRQSIPANTTTLGTWERLPVRRGRRITQEEIAEALGISRSWYRRLESGDAPRASAKLLDRIANALRFTHEERTKLFVLGIPEIAI